MKLHTQKLQKLHACEEALAFVEQFDDFNSAQKACTNLDWFVWLFNTLQLHEEYRRVTNAAYEEYLRVKNSARKEYHRVTNPAYEEYLRVKNPARKEYQRVINVAYEEYLRVKNSAWKEFLRVINSAWKEYEQTVLPLLQTYSLKDHIL